MKRLALSMALVGLASLPAHALQFTRSDVTGQGGLVFNVNLNSPEVFGFNADLKARLAPGLNDLIGGTAFQASFLGDGALNLGYNWALLDLELGLLGKVRPVLRPFVGYRYLGALSAAGSASFTAGPSSTIQYNNFHGPNYGLELKAELPLGFSAYAMGGATTLIGGGYDVRQNRLDITGRGDVSPGGTTLPVLGVGARWSLMELITLYAGWEYFQLPTDMRTQAAIMDGSKRANIQSLSVGATFLFFGI